jgi:hypothetical protein
MKLSKRNVGFAAALAGVLAVAGCQRSDRDRQGEGTAMKSAERSAEQAANQQERAADKAGEAADARKDVADEQKDLAKARADAQKDVQEEKADAQKDVQDEKKDLAEARGEAQEKTAEAQAAQQQAEQKSGQAGQQMERGQQAMGGQAQAGMGAQTASGELVRASSEEIVLRPEGGQQGELTLKVNESTPVTIDGREGKLSDLKEGTQVRASYEDAQGERTATSIEAQQSK